VETPDAELVQRAQAGEAAAFDVLVNRYYALALRYAWRQLGNREDAEEVVQDAFVRAYRSVRGCHEPARFRGWLFTILINRCRTHAGRNRRRFLLFERWREREQPASSSAPQTLRLDGDQEVARALASLSPRLREAFLLKYIEEMSYEEMAQATGVGVSALKMRVKRATDALAAQLKKELHV
jgi:RNA polymerase sigma-70 factor (ECF subfamily)